VVARRDDELQPVHGAVRMGTSGPGLSPVVSGVYRGGVAVSAPTVPALPKPLLRGVLHQAAFSVSLVVGTLLIVGADGARRQVAAAVFAGSVAVCFGASALYHRVTLTPRLRLWMRRVDHTGVYLLIAGAYTPVCLLVLDGGWLCW
jgi:predicted membrane channel-forming protein YqfA (hemolysin III family)